MGNRLNIPVPPERRLSEGVTQKGRGSSEWIARSKPSRRLFRQIRIANTLRGEGESRRGHKLPEPILPRKTSSEL
jgi:hypothetical protein